MKPKRHQIIYRNGIANQDLSSIVNDYDVCTVTIEEGEPKKRSLNSNALMHVWYSEIAEYTGHTLNQIVGYCKASFGFPILLNNIESEAEKVPAYMVKKTFDSINYNVQDFQRKCDIAFKTPCTSLMSKRQHKIYMDQLQKEYAPSLILEVR